VMRRRRLALAAGGAALVGVLVLGGLAWLAATRADRLLAAAGRRLGRAIHADHVGWSVRGGVGVALDGVRIADDPAFARDEPFLAARRLEMRLQVLPLVRGRAVVDRVVIEEPVLNVVRDARGRLNVDSLGPPRQAGARASPAPARAASHRRSFQLVSLRLRHGTFRYREQASGRTIAIEDLALDAREPRFGAPVPLALRARLDGRDLRLDNIVSEGVLDLASERPGYTGTFSAGPGTLGELPLVSIKAKIRASPPLLALESATVALLDGTVAGAGEIRSEGPSSGLTAELTGSGLDLEKLPGRADRPRPAGALGFDAKLGGPPPGAPGFRDALTGTGHFEVAHGRLTGMPLGRVLTEVLAPILGGSAADRLRDRYPDLFSGDELRFTKLSGSGRLAEGRITSDDLVVAGASYAAHGAGSLGLDGQVDAQIRLSASGALTDDVLGRSRARPVLVDAQGLLTVPLRVHGPLEHPHVTPDGGYAAKVARGLLGGTGLEDVAGDLVERFLGGKKRRGR
jgi:uncharacterized protein involved in outer membrane biogenesis